MNNDTIVARIMSIRNGMTLDADAEALIRDALDAPQGSMERISIETLAKHFNTSVSDAKIAQDSIGFMYREIADGLDARQTSPGTETARRKERISMAKEICSHRGENSNAVDRRGNEGWEKYEPLAGACIREAERLFALRDHAQDQKLSVLIKQYAIDLRRNASGGDDYPYEYAKATADYLEELIKRAKGNCTCAQAGFPDSCDNCDAFGHAPCSKEKAFKNLLAAARLMPRATPGPGAAGTIHNFPIEAAYVWALDRACEDAERALSDTSTDRKDDTDHIDWDTLAEERLEQRPRGPTVTPPVREGE